MTQIMRDRMRDEGGGLSTALLWTHLLVDLTKSAFRERTETAMSSVKTVWWRLAAVLVAAVLAAFGWKGLLDPASGPWYQWVIGRAVVASAPLVIIAGLIVRTRTSRAGSIVVAVGVLPGVAAIVLFWHPLFLMFGLLSIAVLTGAVNDADKSSRASTAASVTGA